MSRWFRASTTPEALAGDAVDAVQGSFGAPGGVATLVVPADLSWQEAGDPASSRPGPVVAGVGDDAVADAAKALRSGEPAVLLVGGKAVRARGLLAASAVAQASGAKLLCETFPARIERGAGLPAVERLGYLAEFTIAQLQGARHLVLADAAGPRVVLRLPGDPRLPRPRRVRGPHPRHGVRGRRRGARGPGRRAGRAPDSAILQAPARPDRPTGALNAQSLAAAIGALLPEDAVVSDEGNTSGLFVSGATAGAPRHDWMSLTGGAIGQGLPVATGAAVACPDRPVLCLEADGSAMYTLQSLWTQAREGLDVTTVLINNGSYAILELELSRVGAGDPGPRARGMLDISHPDLNFVALASGMGVPASRATTAEEFTQQLERAFATPGPALVEAVLARP